MIRQLLNAAAHISTFPPILPYLSCLIHALSEEQFRKLFKRKDYLDNSPISFEEFRNAIGKAKCKYLNGRLSPVSDGYTLFLLL